MEPAYTYRAHVVSVYDGDTLRVDLDLGFETWLKNRSLRLFGINAPEMTGDSRKAGIVCRDRVRALVMGRDIIVKTLKDATEKYGRHLAYVHVCNDGVWTCVNTLLVDEGLAIVYLP